MEKEIVNIDKPRVFNKALNDFVYSRESYLRSRLKPHSYCPGILTIGPFVSQSWA